MSLATHTWARDICPRIRAISEKLGGHVAILSDSQGPSIRTGDVDGELSLQKGDWVEFRKADAEPSMKLSTTVNYAGLMADVSVGDGLIADNGDLLMRIKAVDVDRVVCEVKADGRMGGWAVDATSTCLE